MLNHPLLIWLALIVLTLVSYALTDQSTLPWITAVIVTLTAVKGALIIDGFMELHGLRHLLRRGLHLYCPLLGLLIWLVLMR